MIAKGLETGFNRVYYLIKLSLYFWGLSLSGLIVFGFVPALLTLTEIHQEAAWNYKELTWKKSWALFKAYIIRGNQMMLIFGSTILFLLLNLYLSVQTQGFIFVVIDFLIIAVLFLIINVFILSILITVTYEINLSNTLKLAFITFFTSLKECLVAGIYLVVIWTITYRYPGLILFISVGLSVAVVNQVTTKIFNRLKIESI